MRNLHSFIVILSLIFTSCVAEESSKAKDYNPEQKLEELGIQLSTPSSPVANYVNTVKTGNLIFISGKGPLKKDGNYVLGKLGENLTLEQGYEAARLTAINLISTLKASIGDLSKVKRIVRVTGMVNATSDFTDHPKVVNGCSDLLVEVFGDNGKHTRAAVGMNSLPLNIAVEIDMVVEVYD
jgi:enamine deaminase RidA (YjgF/YER057c/UK114 family)